MKKTNASILIVDDNEDVLLAAKILLKNVFEKVFTLSKANQTMSFLTENKIDVVLLDMNFKIGYEDGQEGIYFLKEIKKHHPKIPIVLMTAFGQVETAVEGIKLGAWDYLLKPWDNQKLVEIIKMAVIQSRKLLQKSQQKSDFNYFIGQSQRSQYAFKLAKKVAPTDAHVLILGENGSGKYVMARYIHENSKRSEKHFITIDLGSLNENIFESELFGYAKGAFTDAKSDQIGKLESANGGTVFLDEIGNISLQMQTKLLQLIQDKTIVRLGETYPKKLDIRFIFATNINIAEEIKNKNFREDLYYRINTFEIEQPPLRERQEDILPLAHFFINRFKEKYHLDNLHLDNKAQQVMIKHYWPGNVRELENRLERASIICENEIITLNDIDLINYMPNIQTSEEKSLEDLEKNAIEKTLIKYNYNITKTAHELGLTRASLYRRIEKFNLQNDD